MKASDFDPVLLEAERRYAAAVFAGWGEVEPDQYDVEAAADIAVFLDAISLYGGERLISVWEVDDQLVVVAAAVVGEGEPHRQAFVLEA
jgi:hypothetical protein